MADIVESFKRSALYFKLGLLGILVTNLVHIIGFSTVGWASVSIRGKVRAGLWRVCICFSSNCNCIKTPQGQFEWIKSVRAMETIGLIVLLLAIGCSFAYLVVPERKYVRESCIVSPLLAGLFILIGICVCAAELPDHFDLGYSFAFCCCSGVFAIGVTVLLYIGTKTPPNEADTPTPEPSLAV